LLSEKVELGISKYDKVVGGGYRAGTSTYIETKEVIVFFNKDGGVRTAFPNIKEVKK